MALLGRLVLLGSVLQLAHLGSAQTIKSVTDGRIIEANEGTVVPAAQQVEGSGLQLTDAVLANLTQLQLSNISLFQFANESDQPKQSRSDGCKTYPGDVLYPSQSVWRIFDLLTGGALIKTVPIGAACYQNSDHYDYAKCQAILAGWTDDAVHEADPTSAMSPLYQGLTCLPQNANVSGATCEIGGYPTYAVNISSVAQIQLAINFARSTNVRLVVRNTGHDFLGKSIGYGALSIWTHNLKDLEFVEQYSDQSSDYSGPAVKVGAGVNVGELYAFADKHGVTAVGGECKGVGVAGGYFTGGGHSPLTGKYGMAADHVLSIDVVLPSGRYVTANAHQNQDLFWAIRGGGGATWGVVTSVTFKVHPKLNFSGVTWNITSGTDTNNTDDLFFEALYAYWRRFPGWADQGSYGYSKIYSRGTGAGYAWDMLPWLVPGMGLDDFKEMVADIFDEWTEMGFDFTPEYFEHDNFYETWSTHFPTETVANTNLHTGSRLFPRKTWEDEVLLNKTMDTIRSIVEDGSRLIQYNVNGAAVPDTPDSAVLPAWRDTVFFAIVGVSWADGISEDELKAANEKLTDDIMQRLRDVTPGSGSYLNEGDVMEPNFGEAFYGANYDRLLQIKAEVDPWDTFWAPTAVGSEDWYITDVPDWLTYQTGKLCRKQN
ncbi:restculine oxidase precursor [Aspergillus flavus]|nr:restculine oxidase precursor [Aspergillus flavus]